MPWPRLGAESLAGIRSLELTRHRTLARTGRQLMDASGQPTHEGHEGSERRGVKLLRVAYSYVPSQSASSPVVSYRGCSRGAPSNALASLSLRPYRRADAQGATQLRLISAGTCSVAVHPACGLSTAISLNNRLFEAGHSQDLSRALPRMETDRQLRFWEG